MEQQETPHIDLKVFNRLAQQRRHFELDQTEQLERRRKTEADRDNDDGLVDLALGFLLTPEIQRLSLRIDRYQSATVEALQRNEEALAAANARLEALLDNAFVLPDGRRVFRTEDGSRVFDEHGNALAEDEIDPDMIPEGRTTWEDYQTEVEEHERLRQERQDLLDYQDRLDDARERLEEGGLTDDELDDIAEDLEDLMPAAVRDQLRASDPDAEPEQRPSERPAQDETHDFGTGQPFAIR